jgi:cytidylate kinase
MVDRSKQFEKCQAYIMSHTGNQEPGEEKAPGRYPSITLSRETGAGAHTLGDKLADYLNARKGKAEPRWTVFDKNLVQQVLEDHDLPGYLEKFMPEDKSSHIKDAFGDWLGAHPPNWELMKHTQETIYRLARMGHTILVGRGANIITRDLPNILHLRLVGDLEHRVKRCMNYYQIGENEAMELIKKQDKARRRYLQAYYDREIDDPMNYHFVINVDRFTTDQLVKFISGLVVRNSR